MKRKLFTVFSAVSLLLFAAVCVMWARSYFVNDSWSVGSPFAPELYSNRGSLACVKRWEFQWIAPAADDQIRTNVFVPIPFQYRVRTLPGLQIRENWLASDLSRPTVFDFLYMRSVMVDYWLLAALAAVLPGIVLRRALRTRTLRRRARVGLCPTCGYDLRATPDQCPECGAAGKLLT